VEVGIDLGGTLATVRLNNREAPQTTRSLLEQLPLRTRVLPVKYSGDALYTEDNFELGSKDSAIENLAGPLEAGDIIYFARYASSQPNSGDQRFRIGFAFGPAQWKGPYGVPSGTEAMSPYAVCLLGRVTTNLDAFVATCRTATIDSPLGLSFNWII
jgi:hypothetical protein